VSFSAVWNILAATRAIFFLFAEAIDDILDLALFAFLLLSRLKCVLHFRRVWFSFQKLQSFHTKRKKHISNKMDSEEEKKEDKGEHINLKVKDQVRFCR
jgi:hypothetical protein